MTTRGLVDPQLLGYLEMFPALDLSTEGLAVTNALIRDLLANASPSVAPGWVVERETARCRLDGHDVPLIVTRPEQPTGRRSAALVWFHGGGYVLGLADQDQPMLQELALDLGLVTISVDYRLAPGSPHPAPVEDGFAALEWIHTNAERLGVDPARVLVGGESAGGGLAAGLCLLARDRLAPPIAKQVLIYPMLDDRTVAQPEPNPITGEFVWTRAQNAFAWAALLAGAPGAPDVSPYAAPARAEDLAGLPPTYLEVGELDLFADEDLDFGRRLTRAGIPCEVHLVAGAPHGYIHAGDVRIVADHRTRLRAALRAVAQPTRPAVPASSRTASGRCSTS